MENDKFIYLKIDESIDTIDSLKMTYYFLRNTLEDKYVWKWVILTLHQAVQGYMVLALKGTSHLNVMDKHYQQRSNEADIFDRIVNNDLKQQLQNAGFPIPKYPRTRLKSFLDLYEQTKSPPEHCVKAFTPEGTQGGSIKKLNELRDDFIHYDPKSWIIILNGLPDLIEDCIIFISFLVFDMENKDNPIKSETEALIKEIRELLPSIRSKYLLTE